MGTETKFLNNINITLTCAGNSSPHLCQPNTFFCPLSTLNSVTSLLYHLRVSHSHSTACVKYLGCPVLITVYLTKSWVFLISMFFRHPIIICNYQLEPCIAFTSYSGTIYHLHGKHLYTHLHSQEILCSESQRKINLFTPGMRRHGSEDPHRQEWNSFCYSPHPPKLYFFSFDNFQR